MTSVLSAKKNELSRRVLDHRHLSLAAAKYIPGCRAIFLLAAWLVGRLSRLYAHRHSRSERIIPPTIDDKVYVGQIFFLQSLFDESNSSGEYFVLSLSWDEAKLCRADRASFNLAETEALPAKVSSAIYNSGLPLVGMATKEVTGHFETWNKLKIDASVDGSTSEWSSIEMQKHVRITVELLLHIKTSEFCERFATAMARSQGAQELDQVLEAANSVSNPATIPSRSSHQL